jgi:hypothetical protein
MTPNTNHRILAEVAPVVSLLAGLAGLLAIAAPSL